MLVLDGSINIHGPYHDIDQRFSLCLSDFLIREDGCEAIVCLCGHNFCWECGAGEDCQCGHGEGDYFDNILGQEGYTQNRTANAEEIQDLRSFLESYRQEAGLSDEEDEEI